MTIFIRQSETICAIFVRGHYEEHFCEIILNLDPVVKEEMSLKDISFFRSDGHFI